MESQNCSFYVDKNLLQKASSNAGSARQDQGGNLSFLKLSALQLPKNVSNFDLTISGFLPQMSMRRMRTTAEGNSIKVMAMKLVVSPSERFEII